MVMYFCTVHEQIILKITIKSAEAKKKNAQNINKLKNKWIKDLLNSFWKVAFERYISIYAWILYPNFWHV